jgi:ubiquinone/menaquinone biosynthesis C-methylase UbiE
MANKGKGDSPAFVSLLFKLLKFKSVAKITAKIFDSYERIWDTLAITKKNAMDSVLAEVKDEGEFDLSGEKIAETLKEFITPGDIVLDVGCGIGRIEKHLAKYCAKIYAVDVSKRMVKHTKRRLKGLNNVYIYKTNGKDLSLFPDEKFDFVFSIIVLQHLEKEDAVFYLLEMYRVLKPSGKLYFNVPNFFEEGNFKYFMNTYVMDPSSRTAIKMRYYCSQEIKKTLNSIGFNVVSLREDTYIEILAKKIYKSEDEDKEKKYPKQQRFMPDSW